MDTSIASLFDDDDVEEVPRRHKTPHSDDEDDVFTSRPAKRRRRTLGTGSDDDDEDDRVIPPRDLNTRAMEDLDDDGPGVVWEGAEKLEQQIAAKLKRTQPPPMTPHAILPSSSPPREGAPDGNKKDKDEKKPRRKPVKLDDNLLVGDKGFPKLIGDMKGFKPKGKGHEASDLNRLLQVYQFWTHQLYPKAPFRDTVTRIEKLCHSKRMLNNLSRWKDESKGITVPLEEDEDSDSDDDDAEIGGKRTEKNGRRSDAGSEGPSMSDAPGPLDSQPSSRPPTSASDRVEFDEEGLYDEDFEALMREEAESRPAGAKPVSRPTEDEPMDMLDDDSLWAQIDDADMNDPAPTTAPPPPNSKPTDDSMDWDVLDEMEDFFTAPATSSKAPPAGDARPQSPSRSLEPPPAKPVVEEDDMDDFYV